MPGSITVEARGMTGPYHVKMRAEVASELKIAGEIDVVKVFRVKEDDDDDLECTFQVSQLTLDERPVHDEDNKAAVKWIKRTQRNIENAYWQLEKNAESIGKELFAEL